MTSKQALNTRQESLAGVAYVIPSFLIWGLSPIYWKVLGDVPAFETLMHRVIWSLLFLLPFLILRTRRHEILTVLKNRRTVLILIATTFFVGVNWFVFIWAINHDYVLQASLGYYMTPLVHVLLGVVFLRERLRNLQVAAVFLAGFGVVYLTIQYGQFPWVALSLAFTFGLYGLIRKVAPVSAVGGLTVEMLFASIPALIYLFYLETKGMGSLFHISLKIDMFLIGTALVTALPLALFTLGTRRLHLSTVGFLQYIAPSCFFLLAVFIYHEPISRAQVWTFFLIWAALGVYSIDSVLVYKRTVR
ncbi:MAG: EamA family transporter RarD [Deltaproteobacteria bacterium]|nr:EamA family transporter RarD [Deltaproteobacteria bacterium]MBW2141411.1 EamA family transporter RarD [Deltaproteobacteria bacterium]MBW2324011.1 EamA family transporter RarD [Deltaproteobacteria bacterium]